MAYSKYTKTLNAMGQEAVEAILQKMAGQSFQGKDADERAAAAAGISIEALGEMGEEDLVQVAVNGRYVYFHSAETLAKAGY